MMHIILFTFLGFFAAKADETDGYHYKKTLRSYCNYYDGRYSMKWVWHPEGMEDPMHNDDKIITFEKCQRICDLDSDCRAFSHYDITGTDLSSDHSICWIVYQNGPFIAIPGELPITCNEKIHPTIVDPPALPATFIGKGTCMSSDHYFPLTLYKYLEGGDKEACSKKCARTAHCIGFSVKYDTLHLDNCKLYRGSYIDGSSGDDEDQECYSVCRDCQDMDKYNIMEGSCAGDDGQPPNHYIWRKEKFTDAPPGDEDMLNDSACRDVCTNDDICVGYETSSNKDKKSLCKIMIERTEYSSDTAEKGRKCYQKKEFDRVLPNFEKVGTGKCTVNDEVPKVQLIYAPKSDCKKQCDLVDNCYGYNWVNSNECYMWMEGPIDGFDKSYYAYGTCRKKIPTNMRQTVAGVYASRNYITVGAIAIGLMSAAVAIAWNFKKGDHGDEVETLI